MTRTQFTTQRRVVQESPHYGLGGFKLNVYRTVLYSRQHKLGAVEVSIAPGGYRVSQLDRDTGYEVQHEFIKNIVLAIKKADEIADAENVKYNAWLIGGAI